VDREGSVTYVLRPTINRVLHRLVCEVQIKNNIKIVTFRSSTVIYNMTDVGVDIMVVNVRGQRSMTPVYLGKTGELG
jgi:vacuolar protein sorting-associated protein 13A/C